MFLTFCPQVIFFSPASLYLVTDHLCSLPLWFLASTCLCNFFSPPFISLSFSHQPFRLSWPFSVVPLPTSPSSLCWPQFFGTLSPSMSTNSPNSCPHYSSSSWWLSLLFQPVLCYLSLWAFFAMYWEHDGGFLCGVPMPRALPSRESWSTSSAQTFCPDHALCRRKLWRLADGLHQNFWESYHVQTATFQCFILWSVLILSDNVWDGKRHICGIRAVMLQRACLKVWRLLSFLNMSLTNVTPGKNQHVSPYPYSRT